VLDETLFCVCERAPEVLFIGLEREFECVYKSKQCRPRAAVAAAGSNCFRKRNCPRFLKEPPVLFLSVLIGSYVLSFCSGAYCTKLSFLGAVACSSEDDDVLRWRVV
jgi:hypothetical protein